MHESQNMKISACCILACLYFFLLPTTIAVNSAGNSILKLATLPIGVYFLVTIIVSKKVLQLNGIHLLLCIYTLSTVITLFVNSSSMSVDYVVGYCLNALLYICLSVVKYNDRELKLLEDVQILLLMVLLGLTFFSNGSSHDRTTLIILGQTCDPNYFVGYFVFPLSITMKRIVESKYHIVYVLLAFLSIYCVLLSGSRGGLIAIVVLIIAFALIYPPKIKHKILVLLGGCCFVVCAWFFAAPFLSENIIERMSVENVIETGGTGRWYIWKSMLAEIFNSPNDFLLGRGIHSLHEIFIHGRWGTAVAHNQMIQVLYNQGFIGLIAFTALTIGCFLNCIKKRKTVSIAIIGMMALSISLSFNQTTRTFWNLVAYAAINFSENEYYISEKTLKLPEENNNGGNRK